MNGRLGTAFWKNAGGGGGGPANPCGTGASYPPGWRFLHSEISGGLGSWGNMLKVEGYNSFGATLNSLSEGSLDVCYLNGEIDMGAADSFYSADADVDNQYDQFELNNMIDYVAGAGYNKAANRINMGGCITSGLTGSLASLKFGDPWTCCMVIDFTSTPPFAVPFGFLNGSPGLRVQFTGSNTFIVRFDGPNQGYFYTGLRTSGTKLIIISYDGTLPINRSGLNLYWNGNSTPETPAGIYNIGTPSNNTINNVAFRGNQSNPDFSGEFDPFDHAFSAAEITTAKEVYEQKYTFS